MARGGWPQGARRPSAYGGHDVAAKQIRERGRCARGRRRPFLVVRAGDSMVFLHGIQNVGLILQEQA